MRFAALSLALLAATPAHAQPRLPAGVEAELVVIKGGGHGGAGFGTPEMQEKITAFFDKHLKK